MIPPFVHGWLPALLVLLLPALGGVSPERAGAADRSLCWGLALEGHPVTTGMIEAAEKEVGIPARIVVFFLQWPSNPEEGRFPGESLDAVRGKGAVPCITWEPMYYENGREITIPHRRILEGGYDAYLASFAKAAREWGGPILLRFAHEMNLSRYHWGTSMEEYGPSSPEIYRQMFRYVVSAFRKAGAANVLWAFCPNAESVPNVSFDPSSAWNEVSAYYPGADSVDVVGADGYNWGTTQTREENGWDSRWRSFGEIFGPVHAQLRALAPDKPFLVFETASVVEGGDKGRWVLEAVRTAEEWRLAGITWFHVQKEQDWRFHRGLEGIRLEAVRSRLKCTPGIFEGKKRMGGFRRE